MGHFKPQPVYCEDKFLCALAGVIKGADKAACRKYINWIYSNGYTYYIDSKISRMKGVLFGSTNAPVIVVMTIERRKYEQAVTELHAFRKCRLER